MTGSDGQTATVHYSTTGERFHGIPDCPAYELGRSAWDTDEPPPGWPSSPVFLQRTVAAAMGAGKLPCTRCLPGLLAAWFQGTCEEDFGHEPFHYDGAVICRRCYIQHAGWRETIFWPCTSAIVLGLAPRQERNDR